MISYIRIVSCTLALMAGTGTASSWDQRFSFPKKWDTKMKATAERNGYDGLFVYGFNKCVRSYHYLNTVMELREKLHISNTKPLYIQIGNQKVLDTEKMGLDSIVRKRMRKEIIRNRKDFVKGFTEKVFSKARGIAFEETFYQVALGGAEKQNIMISTQMAKDYMKGEEQKLENIMIQFCLKCLDNFAFLEGKAYRQSVWSVDLDYDLDDLLGRLECYRYKRTGMELPIGASVKQTSRSTAKPLCPLEQIRQRIHNLPQRIIAKSTKSKPVSKQIQGKSRTGNVKWKNRMPRGRDIRKPKRGLCNCDCDDF